MWDTLLKAVEVLINPSLILFAGWYFNKRMEKFKGEITGEVEILRASLSRENIGFQIYITEYAKIKFKRLDDLYEAIYYFQKYVKDNLTHIAGDSDFEIKKEEFLKYYNRTQDKVKLASLYLSGESMDCISDLLRESYSAYRRFLRYKRAGAGAMADAHEKSILEEKEEALNKLEKTIAGFPPLLERIEKELKASLIYGEHEKAKA
jgi:hypothetical protein